MSQLNAALNLGLVPRATWPRREDADALVGGEVAIGTLDTGLIEACPGDRRLGVVGHNETG